MHKPSAQLPDMLPRFGWNISFRRAICEALAETLNLAPEPDPTPSTPAESPLTSYLVEHLEVNCLATEKDKAARYPLESAVAIARAVERDAQAGADLRAADVDEIAVVLGRRPEDRADGLAQLDQLIADGPVPHLPDLVRLLSRIERRQEYLLKPLMIFQASEALERLA
jgi:hypothetical protein